MAFPPVRIVAAVGGLLLLVSVFVEWLFGLNATDVPLEALWSDSASGGFGLGWILLVLGGGGMALSFVAGAAPWRRVLGVLGLGLTAVFIGRLIVTATSDGASVGDVLGAMGIGPWLAAAGAVLLILSPAGRASAGSPHPA